MALLFPMNFIRKISNAVVNYEAVTLTQMNSKKHAITCAC